MKKFQISPVNFASKRKHNLLLLGFFSDQLQADLKHELIKTKFGSVSILSEQKRIFVCLGKRKAFQPSRLKLVLTIVGQIDFDFDFDFATFVTKKITEQTVVKQFLGVYYFQRHKVKNYQKKRSTPLVNKINLLVGKSPTSLKVWKKIWQEHAIIGDAVNYCRDLQDEAPNILHSEVFATKIKKDFANVAGVTCRILNKQDIIKEKMNLVLAVNAGSQYEPRVVVLRYLGNPQNKSITALIGKGITFDTGGYSLKPSNYQIGMKYDMSGAAAAISVMKAISALSLAVNLVVVACLTDNVVDAQATLVESVITSKSGKTVEITNTDAEGRLILADTITFAIEHFQPKQIIELSTLTGAISVALGDTVTGAFTNKSGLYQNFVRAAKMADEHVWLLPVTAENIKNMKSSIADLVNASSTYKGGSSNAAAFLFAFADKTPFLHLDIAGTATKPENKRGTGVMVHSLIRFFFQENQQKKRITKIKK